MLNKVCVCQNSFTVSHQLAFQIYLLCRSALSYHDKCIVIPLHVIYSVDNTHVMCMIFVGSYTLLCTFYLAMSIKANAASMKGIQSLATYSNNNVLSYGSSYITSDSCIVAN